MAVTRPRGARAATWAWSWTVCCLLALAACVPSKAPDPANGAQRVDPELAELADACKRGQAASCLSVADGYQRISEPSGEDRRRLVASLYRGCMLGEAVACRRLAQLYRTEPRLLEPDRRRLGRAIAHFCASQYPRSPSHCIAAALHARACDGGEAASCADLASMVDAGVLDGRHEIKARKLRELACERGHTQSCEQLARVLIDGAHGVEADPAGAAVLFGRTCEAGSPRGCRGLAGLHARGWGVVLDLERARALRQMACEGGDGEGCHAYAQMLTRGLGGDTDEGLAIEQLRRACRQGSAAGCVTLARRVEQGRGVPATPALAFDLYRKGATLYQHKCDGGDQAACSGLGTLLAEGSGIRKDAERGLAMQRRACESGQPDGCRRWLAGARGSGRADREAVAAVMTGGCRRGRGDACFVLGYLAVGASQHPSLPDAVAAFTRGCILGDGPSCNAAGIDSFPPTPEGRRLLERGCDLGDAPSCHHLAITLEFPGSSQDRERAAILYRRSCRDDLATSCTRLGTLRGTGLNDGVNPGASAALYERACVLGDPQGCYHLAAMLLDGTRISRDIARGVGYLERSCRMGDQAACGHLGGLLVRGAGVTPELARGEQLLVSACRGGAVSACVTLAESLRRGRGVEVDEPRALSLLETAAEATGACDERIAVCHEGAQVRQGRVWSRWHRRPARFVVPLPTCDLTLDRVCNEAAEAVVQRCEHGRDGCIEAGALLRRMAAVGLAVSAPRREAVDKRAYDRARERCDRRVAPACLRAADAYQLGRGVRKDERAAKRFREKACRIDPDLCG